MEGWTRRAEECLWQMASQYPSTGTNANKGSPVWLLFIGGVSLSISLRHGFSISISHFFTLRHLFHPFLFSSSRAPLVSSPPSSPPISLEEHEVDGGRGGGFLK